MEETVKNEKNWKICSSFILKLVAFITMAIDHIGAMASFNYIGGTFFDICRIIGRIAMPLFCFMIVEGVLHTKSFKKYALRLGIMAFIISTSLLIMVSFPQMGFSGVRDFGNIFLDLLMGAIAIYCLRLKGFKKIFALLPTAFVITSFVVSRYEYLNGSMIHWFPYFIRTQYGLMAYVFILLFYLSYLLVGIYLKYHAKSLAMPEDTFNGSDLERTTVNILSTLFLLSAVLLFHLLRYYLTFYYMDVQIYALFAGAFILLYNGRRGYNSKWFEYGGYLFYPVHILIIALVFYLITL